MILIMPEAVVIPPGTGPRTGNVEFLCLTEHSPRFNVSLIAMAPHRHGPPIHTHDEEDDAFFILEGELTFELPPHDDVIAGPGTFVLVPPHVVHTFRNDTDAVVRILNIHAPAGFDRRLLDD
jgi:quercetin dioxygenase-like cupin family protein